MKNFSNQYKKFLSKKAFSLTELSMVILIIGILIGGISLGIDLYKDFIKLNVKKLTLNSPAGRTPDLAAWYETTQEQFVTYRGVWGLPRLESPWKDINPQSTRKKNLTGRIYLDTSETFQRLFFTYNWAYANSELMPQSEFSFLGGKYNFFCFNMY